MSPTAPSAPLPSPILEIDRDTFAEKFNRLPFMLPHGMANHPLFDIPSMVELARRHPINQVALSPAKVAPNSDIDRPPPTGRTPLETLERIEETDSWALFYQVHKDPVIGPVVTQLLDEIEKHSELIEPGMCDRMAYLFVASPGAITPFHMDRDINCLLQFKGEKRVYIWDPMDRTVLPEAGLETLFARPQLPRPTYDESFERRAYAFDLKPGFAVHHPFTAPHYVKNKDNVSVSMSVTFRTRESHRRMSVHKTNFYLRRMGLSPAPYARSGAVDRVKSTVYETLTGARDLLRR